MSSGSGSGRTWTARFAGRRATRVGFALLVVLHGVAALAPLIANDRPYVLVATDERAYERARKTLPIVVRELHDDLKWLATPDDLGEGAYYDSVEREWAAELDAVRQRLIVLRRSVDAATGERIDAFRSDLEAPGASSTITTERAEALAAGLALEPVEMLPPTEDGEVLPRVRLVPRRTFPLLEALTALDGALVALWLALASAPLWWRRARRAGLVAAGVTTVVFAAGGAAFEPEVTDVKAGIASGGVVAERAVFPPVPYGFAETHLDEDLRPPSWAGASAGGGVRVRPGEAAADSPLRHLLGTDTLGRDVLARLLHGARPSLAVGALAAGLVFLLGVALGGVAGFRGGVVDALFLRVVEVVQSFPGLLLTLVAVALVPPGSLPPVVTIAGIIALVRWTGVARLTRTELLRARELEMTDAARAIGLPDWRILLHHLLPAAMPPVLVATAFATSGAILTESAISFLGLGLGAPTPSWGGLIALERDVSVWWLQVFPGAMIFLTVVAWNLVGEGLREALDPRAAGGVAPTRRPSG